LLRNTFNGMKEYLLLNQPEDRTKRACIVQEFIEVKMCTSDIF